MIITDAVMQRMAEMAKTENALARPTWDHSFASSSKTFGSTGTVQDMARKRQWDAWRLYLGAATKTPQHASEIAAAVGRQTNSTSRQLIKLAKLGYLREEFTDRGRLFTLAAKGRKWLQENGGLQ